MRSAYNEEVATFWITPMPDGFDPTKVFQLHYYYDEKLKACIQWSTVWKDRERNYA